LVDTETKRYYNKDIATANRSKKMLLADAVTTIAFRDADLDLLMAALRHYRDTAPNLDANTRALANSVTDLVVDAMRDY
jgi:hypothetical protein